MRLISAGGVAHREIRARKDERQIIAARRAEADGIVAAFHHDLVLALVDATPVDHVQAQRIALGCQVKQSAIGVQVTVEKAVRRLA